MHIVEFYIFWIRMKALLENEFKYGEVIIMKLVSTGIILLSSLLLSGVGLIMPSEINTKSETVLASTSDDSLGKVDLQIDEQGIIPVANQNNDTLQQVSENNNIDLNTLEQLNGDINPNQPLPNGAPIYLPQNQLMASNSLDSDNAVDAESAKSGLTAAQWQEYYESYGKANRDAKIWIAFHESRYDYNARNGQYIGRFQLAEAYLNGDWSVDNQERTADRYVQQRYGSWTNAKSFWEIHGWY